MHIFTVVFLAALGLSTAIQLWLVTRQVRHVRANRASVPEAFSEKIGLDAHQKAADYTIAKNRLELIEIIIGSLLLLAWTLGGGLELLDTGVRKISDSLLVSGTVFLLSMMLIMALLDLPMSVWRTFVLEEKFGFNHTTAKTFTGDLLKQTILMLVIAIPMIALVLWLMTNSGPQWWIYVWAVWIGFGLLMMWAYPTFIAPLFNKFVPLEDSPLRTRIQNLLERCGFTSKGIFVVDGSRRTGHGNAYFTGLGRNKRIVFFDTLLNSLGEDEVEAVLAHELGHFRRKHIQKRIIMMAAMSFMGLALLGWLIQQEWFYIALGVNQPSLHAALALFILVLPVFTLFLHPLTAWYSRQHEFEADDFAAEQSNANDLIKALVKLYEENANTLTPDPLYSAFHDSHPPAPVRVAHLSTRS